MVITGSATNILEMSATIVNNIFQEIPGTINSTAVQYSTEPTVSDGATTVTGALNSPFSVNLVGLQPETTYYFRTFVDSTTGMYFGGIRSFTTSKAPPVPTVITGDAINITSGSAVITGNFFSGIPEPILLVAVQYSTDPSMSVGAAMGIGTIGSPFAVNLMGLQDETTYYYRAVVEGSSGQHYGEIKSFKTLQRL